MVALDSLLKSSIQSSILVANPNFHHYLDTLGLAPLLQTATEESLHDYRDQGERNRIHWRCSGGKGNKHRCAPHIISCKTFESMLLREFSSVTAYSMDTIYTFSMRARDYLRCRPFAWAIVHVLKVYTYSPRVDDGKKHNLSAVVSLLTSTYPAPVAFSDEYEVEYLLVPPVPTSPLATVALSETTINQEEPLANLKTRQNPKRVTPYRRFSPLRLARKASRGVRKVRIAFHSMIASLHGKDRSLRSASLSSRFLRKGQEPVRRRTHLCAETGQGRTRVPHKTFPSSILLQA
ncbi:hypothetical protein R3P38DRAFT_2889433 [Favolaschia claudopus]|uniref:Uncharacterized protein n=1 Tax=Favolaschia claudopus TaxID=2862362 RepID=A0AAW0CU77_9AGAR